MIEGIDEVILSKRKHITLTIQPGGKTVLRAPLRSKEGTLRAFVEAQAEWISRARQRMAKLPQAPKPYRFVEGEEILYMGARYPLHIVEKQKSGLVFTEGLGFCLASSHQAQGARLLENFFRKETRRLCQAYLSHYATIKNFTPGPLRINNARTRWGSCSARNSLNFSLRLVMVPLACLEYVVVHELCHTQHHNHGAAFWGLVEEVLPGYRTPRAWLKKYGTSLPPIS
ncbi:MAG TPA: SprT family zinc-dependent metalloprotease [Anaerolineaceae bacterium]|nr:SprT family zinc-dependent metalloprotease [Anaerolineaceae bacterium]